jgi:hypothetical protein
VSTQLNDWSEVYLLNDPSIGLQGELSGPSPIQALGKILGRDFYFHAKHSQWVFEVADDLGNLPSDTGNEEVFTLKSRRKFAGELAPAEAIRVIHECARLFCSVTFAHL